VFTIIFQNRINVSSIFMINKFLLYSIATEKPKVYNNEIHLWFLTNLLYKINNNYIYISQ